MQREIRGLTRDEHIQWRKRRALNYIDQGDLVSAASYMNDPRYQVDPYYMMLGFQHAMADDEPAMRRWIEGFQ